MTMTLLTDLLQSLALLGGALLLGTLLRARIRFLQDTFMPASVIGGLILLILGPQVLGATGKAGIPDEWFEYYSMFPGILIVPIVAAVPLGLRLQRARNGADRGFMKNVLPLFFITLGAAMLQFVIGFSVHMLFGKDGGLYDQFGIELGVGFVGGHGTAGTLGGTLNRMGLPWWEISQGVATTMATVGIIGGILIGILLINWAARTGKTVVFGSPASIPPALRRGFERDASLQPSVGRETTFSTSIDTLAFHTALIFAACGCAYLCRRAAVSAGIPVLKDISVWAYAMLCMAVIWWLMCRLNMDSLVDASVKGHITGNLTEFAVTGAIASLPIRAVADYIVPIIVMSALGFALTAAWLYLLCRKCLKGYWFEQMIASFGMVTGVFITGVLLLRICDPESKTPALAGYSVAYTAMSVCYFALLNLFITLPLGGRTLTALAVGAALSALCLAGALISGAVSFGKKRSGE